jgi:hypothetical protein
MNRAGIGLGLSAGIIVLIVVAIFMTFTRNVRADGSPKQLRELTPAELQKMEQVIPAQAKAKPVKPRKILVFWLCNGYFHESIPVINKAIELMGKKTGAYEAVFSDDMKMFDARKLAEFDGLVFNNTTKLDFNEPSQKQALMDFVKGGKGIIGIHAATDNFYTWPEAAEMMGGTFVYHPWTSGGIWAIKNVEPNHPLNEAFKGEGFKIKDEIYRQKLLKLRENCRVLLALDLDDPATKNAKGALESDRDMPVSWLRNYEKGRVFYCGLGHNNEVIFRSPILQHYLDGIQFALGDLKVDAAPVKQ